MVTMNAFPDKYLFIYDQIKQIKSFINNYYLYIGQWPLSSSPHLTS